jgi:transcriptional regulator with XRE-family HTH domain
MKPTKTELGKYVREKRIELGLKQGTFAKRCGLPGSIISSIELGKTMCPHSSGLYKIAKALNCDLNELRKRIPAKSIGQPITELGKFIRSRREKLGMPIEHLAEKMKISPNEVKRLEIRKNPSISYKRMRLLVEILDCDPSELIKFTGSTLKETKNKLGKLVRTRRQELGLSLEALAKKMNISRQFVSQIELGRSRLTGSSDKIELLAKVLDLDVHKLEAVRPLRRSKAMILSNSLGRLLIIKRLELRLSQREIAERAELHTSIISAYERGRRRPSAYVLNKLAKALNCEIPLGLIPP